MSVSSGTRRVKFRQETRKL